VCVGTVFFWGGGGSFEQGGVSFLYEEWAHPFFISIQEFCRLMEVRGLLGCTAFFAVVVVGGGVGEGMVGVAFLLRAVPHCRPLPHCLDCCC
jgi:hypothetical protein